MKIVLENGEPLTPDQHQRLEDALREIAAVDEELKAEQGCELFFVRNLKGDNEPEFMMWPNRLREQGQPLLAEGPVIDPGADFDIIELFRDRI